MSIPAPPVPLQDSCAVIYDNTLYTYSKSSFLRLKLEPDGKWEELSNGVQVTGGVCVGSTPADADEAGLYIVGGVASDEQYSGLQKFTYSTEEWKSITLEGEVMKRRQWHGAAYLKSSDSILVYAGRVDDVEDFSSETFTIQARSPYGVASSPSNASPAISPLLLPWSDTDVVMVGGDPGNRRVMLFNAETQWQDSEATLADPIPKDARSLTAMLIDGDDGSKSLYTFDMSQFPNAVNRIALIDADGQPIQNSPTLVSRDNVGLAARQSDSDSSTKPLNLDDWPEYDDDYASDEAWSNYAAAQDSDGMVVFARGNEDDPIRMFNARENSWVDASLAFSEQERLGDTSVSSSSSSSSTPTSSATSSSAAETTAAGEDDDTGIGSNAILGIVLGSIVGVLLLLGLLLFLIRRKKAQKQGDSSNGTPNPEHGGPAMAARGPSNASRGYGYGHYPQNSNDSYSSMAILMNKTNQQNKGLGRNPSNGTNRTSMSSIFNKEFKSTISKPIPQSNQYSPEYSEKELEAGDRTTFFGPSLSKRVPRRPTVGSPTQPSEREPEARDRSDDRMTVFGPSLSVRAPPRPPRGNATLGGPSLRPDAIPTDPAERRSSGWNRYWSGGSALNILGFGGKRATMDSDDGSKYSDNKLNRVTQDSATVPPLSMEPFNGRPELNRVHSGSPTVSQAPTQWPIMKEGMTGKIERPHSAGSGYTGYSSGIPESIYDTFDQGEAKKPWGADRAPTAAYGSTAHSQPSSLDPSSTSGQIGVSRQPPLKEAKLSTDMSWLNLGGNNRG